MGQYTAYQLSKELNANYRTVSKVIADFENKGFITLSDFVSENKAKIYNISDEIKEEITTRLQQCKSMQAIVCNTGNDSLLTKNKDLQIQVQEQENTIKSLNELITNKDKELSKMQMDYVKLDSDLKVANSEIKLLTAGKNTMDSEISRLSQEKTQLVHEKESLSKDLKESNKLNKILICVCACVVGVVLCLVVKSLLNL